MKLPRGFNHPLGGFLTFSFQYHSNTITAEQKGGSTMKGNTKKLAVLVIITVIAPFVIAVMASAEPIKGQYASTGEGMCILALFGFKPDSTPSCTPTPQGPVCPTVIQSWSSEAVYSFDEDGTGSLTALLQWVTHSFEGPSGIVPPNAGTQKLSAKFHYNVTDEGKITITADPGTYTMEWISGPMANKTYHVNGWARKGTIAPDGKMIILNSLVTDVMFFIAPYVDMPPTAQVVCNGSNVLIWQHD
jgi:hypothetical protein